MTFTKKAKRRFTRTAVIAITVSVLVSTPRLSSATAPEAVDLTSLSIEELMNVKVTSVGKKSQNLSESAAAIFVISGDDIRRSGVTNIPDALRMVPGLNVARLDANKWAVNIRGFNSRFSAQLLVLIDGRSIYTPTFSGVYWETSDTLLEDVDRIEVIRGPGATLWGANAVNGVINIITKSAEDTRGGLISAGGGNFEQVFGNVRYGGKAGENSHWRAYAKYQNRDSLIFADGNNSDEDAGDNWDMSRGGFRLDSTLTAMDRLTVQGDHYDSTIDQTLFLADTSTLENVETPVKTNSKGTNILARWQRTLSASSNLVLQTYLDTTDRTEDIIDEERTNLDIDFQHRFALGTRQDIVWGIRYRYTDDSYVNSSISDMNPLEREDHLYSTFIQDEITIIPEKLNLTLGSKFEHNNYSGVEFQPSGRLMWSASDTHKFWGAVSRAVRVPSRVESDATIAYYIRDGTPATGGLPVLLNVVGNDDFESEELMAYELGYRFIPKKTVSLDLALFYNDYDNIRYLEEISVINQGTYLERNLAFTNAIEGQTYGLEIAVAYEPADILKFDLAYSFLDYNFVNGSVGGCPRNQASLRTRLDISDDLELDMWIKYVDTSRATYVFSDSGWYDVDEYITLDMRVGWHITKALNLDIVCNNLLDDTRVEFAQEAFSRVVEVDRSIYAKLTMEF